METNRNDAQYTFAENAALWTHKFLWNCIFRRPLLENQLFQSYKPFLTYTSALKSLAYCKLAKLPEGEY